MNRDSDEPWLQKRGNCLESEVCRRYKLAKLGDVRFHIARIIRMLEFGQIGTERGKAMMLGFKLLIDVFDKMRDEKELQRKLAAMDGYATGLQLSAGNPQRVTKEDLEAHRRLALGETDADTE